MGIHLGSTPVSIYTGGIISKPEEEKTVTAGTSAIVVNPSSGKVMKKVTVNPTPTESKSVTPTTSELTVTPSEGKHLSQVVVGAIEDVTPEVTAQTPLVIQILEGLVGKAQGANATADKILEGYSAYVGQELLNGTAKQGRLGIDFGTVLCTEKVDTITIAHNLGVKPTLVGLVKKNDLTCAQYNWDWGTHVILALTNGDYIVSSGSANSNDWYKRVMVAALNNQVNSLPMAEMPEPSVSDSEIVFKAGTGNSGDSTAWFKDEYYWFSIA